MLCNLEKDYNTFLMRATQFGQKEFGFNASVHVVSVNDYLTKFTILSDHIHISLVLLPFLFHNTNILRMRDVRCHSS